MPQIERYYVFFREGDSIKRIKILHPSAKFSGIRAFLGGVDRQKSIAHANISGGRAIKALERAGCKLSL